MAEVNGKRREYSGSLYTFTRDATQYRVPTDNKILSADRVLITAVHCVSVESPDLSIERLPCYTNCRQSNWHVEKPPPLPMVKDLQAFSPHRKLCLDTRYCQRVRASMLHRRDSPGH